MKKFAAIASLLFFVPLPARADFVTIGQTNDKQTIFVQTNEVPQWRRDGLFTYFSYWITTSYDSLEPRDGFTLNCQGHKAVKLKQSVNVHPRLGWVVPEGDAARGITADSKTSVELLNLVCRNTL